MTGAEKIRRRIATEKKKFRETGVCSEWLTRQCLKKKKLMRELFPALMPPPPPEEDLLSRLNRVYYNPAILKQFNAQTQLWKWKP